MKSLVIACLTAGLLVPAFGQDMRNNAARSLFSDQKASRVGDAIMILVVEENSASNTAQTTSSRESNLSFSSSGKAGTSNLPEVGLGIGTGNSFKGQGGTSTNGSIRAKLSARIDSVFTNGNLWINGARTIVVNGEEQTIKISGIVRPSDIAYDNSVYSYNIADARISFEGNGIVSRAQGPGWITKLLHWLF
jgi:flagellar L-ring protein precursor FlgH